MVFVVVLLAVFMMMRFVAATPIHAATYQPIRYHYRQFFLLLYAAAAVAATVATPSLCALYAD